MKNKINLGCGHKHFDGFINIDCRSEVKPDLVCNVVDGLPIDDSSIEMVRAFDFLEHVPIGKCIFVIEEIYRVLVDGGTFEHFTPSTDGRGAFQDPTHVSFWNYNSWLYYTGEGMRLQYGIRANFKIGELRDVITDTQGQVIHTYGLMFKEHGA